MLQILTVRPAWVVALLGQALLIPVLLAFNQPGGFHRPPWQYGLQGALAYGLSAAVVIAIGAVVRQRPDAGQ